jgi:hypothetical protein
MFEPEPVEQFVEVARIIQRAESLDAIVQAFPACDDRARAAALGCLSALELSLAQCTAASIEHARDQRIDTSRKLARLLAPWTGAELADSLAEVAVQAVAARSSTLAIARAAANAGTEPVAFAGLAGVMFVSAHAHQFAAHQGLAPRELEALLVDAVGPIRKACKAQDICSVGELRHTAHAGTVAASARLDRSREGAPVIAIRLHREGEQLKLDSPTAQTPPYAARLLRRLVS